MEPCYVANHGPPELVVLGPEQARAGGVVLADVVNPKAVSDGEIFGRHDARTKEWLDGVVASVLRNHTLAKEKGQYWAVRTRGEMVRSFARATDGTIAASQRSRFFSPVASQARSSHPAWPPAQSVPELSSRSWTVRSMRSGLKT